LPPRGEKDKKFAENLSANRNSETPRKSRLFIVPLGKRGGEDCCQSAPKRVMAEVLKALYLNIFPSVLGGNPRTQESPGLALPIMVNSIIF
jgi:hypothetical protein